MSEKNQLIDSIRNTIVDIQDEWNALKTPDEKIAFVNVKKVELEKLVSDLVHQGFDSLTADNFDKFLKLFYQASALLNMLNF